MGDVDATAFLMRSEKPADWRGHAGHHQEGRDEVAVASVRNDSGWNWTPKAGWQ